MGFYFLLGLIIASIFFFLVFFVFGVRTYEKRFNITYNVKNFFPYEIGYNVKFLDNIGINAALILSIFASFASFLYYGVGYSLFENHKIVTILAGIILSFTVLFQFFADLKYIRFHITLFVLTALAAFMLPCGIGILGYVNYQRTEDIFSIILAGISFIFAIFIFASMMNPRLNLKLNMKKAIDKNGKEVLVRPKFFIMAFTEWIYIFSLFIDQLLLLLLLLPR